MVYPFGPQQAGPYPFGAAGAWPWGGVPFGPKDGDAGLAKVAIGSPFVALGDSFVALGWQASGQSYAAAGPGFWAWADLLMGGRLMLPSGGMQGVVGNTLQQMRARMSAVLAASPKIVVLGSGGTNNMAGGDSLATLQSVQQGIYDDCFAGGVEYVVDMTVPPRFAPNDLTAGRETVRQQFNAWKLGLTDPRIKIVDASSLRDWSTGGLNADGLHLNGLGSYTVGAAFRDMLDTIVEAGDPLGTTVNLLARNPLMAGAGGSLSGGATGVVANNFSLSAGSSGATVVGSKGTLNGNDCQVITVSGTYNGTGSGGPGLNSSLIGGAAAALVPGDVTEFIGDIEISGAVNINAVYVEAAIQNSGFSHIGTGSMIYPFSTTEDFPASGSLIYRTPAIAVAAATVPNVASLAFRITPKAGMSAGSPIAVTVKIGKHCFRKV